ncbi:hypothetical protein AOQ84DRAFT_377872 [Glonium stellatum]|uniref:Uncharacterized protein n=1 Tax=Glonium stellatum TaxID=574774 RepID=A0A8E2JRV5_9PEZI|nr:hypothetical protein AOQ84DRAFT_377872 [Glonium stellatum]
MMSYGVRSRRFFSSFSVFRDDNDSEHSEFEEFTQKKPRLASCFCPHIINIHLNPRVGNTYHSKQKPKPPPCRRRPTIKLIRRASKRNGHSTNTSITNRDMDQQESADASQFPGTFSFIDKPLPEIPGPQHQISQLLAPRLGMQESANSSELSIAEGHEILEENSYPTSAQRAAENSPNPLIEKRKNNRMTLSGFGYRPAGKPKEQASHLEVASKLLGNKVTSSRREADPAALDASDRSVTTLPRAHTANHLGLFGSKRSPEDPISNHSDNDNDEPRNMVAKFTGKIVSHLSNLPKPSLPHKNKRTTLSIPTFISNDNMVSPKLVRILGPDWVEARELSKNLNENVDEPEETDAHRFSKRERSFSTNDLSSLMPKSLAVQSTSAVQETQPLREGKTSPAALDTTDLATQKYLEHMKRANLQMPKQFNLPALTTNVLEGPGSRSRPVIEKKESGKAYGNGTGWVEPQGCPQERHAGALAPLDEPKTMWKRSKGRMMSLLPFTTEFSGRPERACETLGIQESACKFPMDNVTEAQQNAADHPTERALSPKLNVTLDSERNDSSQGRYAASGDILSISYANWETLEKLTASRSSCNDGESACSGTNEFPDMHSTPRSAYDTSSRRQAIRLDQSPLKTVRRTESSLSIYDVDEDMADDFYEDAYGSNTYADYYRQDLQPANDETEDDTLTVASYYNYHNRLSTVPEENRMSDTVKCISDPLKRDSADASLLIEEPKPRKQRPVLKIQIPEFWRRPVYPWVDYVADDNRVHVGAEVPFIRQVNEASGQKEHKDLYVASGSPHKGTASVSAAASNLIEQQASGASGSSDASPFPSFNQATNTADAHHLGSPLIFHKRACGYCSSGSSSSSSPRSSHRQSIGAFSKDFFDRHIRRSSTESGRSSMSHRLSTLMVAAIIEKLDLSGNLDEPTVSTETQEPCEGKEDDMMAVDAPLSSLDRKRR